MDNAERFRPKMAAGGERISVVVSKPEKNAEQKTAGPTLSCPQCGALQRRPRWGRVYACGGCGMPFSGVRRRFSLPGWVAAGVAVLLGATLVIGAARARFSGRVDVVAAEAIARPVRLPPNPRGKVLRKVEYILADLVHDPDNVPLLTRLAEYYLYLAVLNAESPGQHRHYLQLCEKTTARLRRLAPEIAAQLDIDLGSPDSLRFTNDSGLTLATATWNSSGERASGEGSSPIAEGMRVSADSASMPQPMALTDAGEAAGQAASQGMMLPGNPLYATNADRMRDPQIIQSDQTILRLRQRLADEPENMLLYDALGRAYRSRAGLEQRLNFDNSQTGEARRDAFLARAVDIYEKAISTTPLRIYKAAFAVRCARAYADQNDLEKQYYWLKRATEMAPYSSSIWRDYRTVCLQTLRFSESHEARRRLRLWQLPALRPAD